MKRGRTFDDEDSIHGTSDHPQKITKTNNSSDTKSTEGVSGSNLGLEQQNNGINGKISDQMVPRFITHNPFLFSFLSPTKNKQANDNVDFSLTDRNNISQQNRTNVIIIDDHSNMDTTNSREENKVKLTKNQDDLLPFNPTKNVDEIKIVENQVHQNRDKGKTGLLECIFAPPMYNNMEYNEKVKFASTNMNCMKCDKNVSKLIDACVTNDKIDETELSSILFFCYNCRRVAHTGCILSTLVIKKNSKINRRTGKYCNLLCINCGFHYEQFKSYDENSKQYKSLRNETKKKYLDHNSPFVMEKKHIDLLKNEKMIDTIKDAVNKGTTKDVNLDLYNNVINPILYSDCWFNKF